MPPRIFLIAPHLGVVMRGFESSSWQLFQALQDAPQVELHLLRGAAPSQHPRDRVAWSLPIGSRGNHLLSALCFRQPSVVAQDSFFGGLLPQLFKFRPQLLILQDRHLAHRLYHLRRFSSLKYKIYFINGGPTLPPFPRFDHVQHLTPFHYQQSIDAGDSPAKVSCLPYGMTIDAEFFSPTVDEKNALRQFLGFPKARPHGGRPVLLCAAALNKAHKRIDALINEVASLPEGERPFLAMFGALTDDATELLQLATQKLGPGNFVMRELHLSDMPHAYRAADFFVLPSLSEGFGMVFVEALAAGLPCLAHDYPVARQVLGGYGLFADFTQPGALAQLVAQAQAELPCQDGYARERHAWAYENYSWDKLRDKYLQAFLSCVGS